MGKIGKKINWQPFDLRNGTTLKGTKEDLVKDHTLIEPNIVEQSQSILSKLENINPSINPSIITQFAESPQDMTSFIPFIFCMLTGTTIASASSIFSADIENSSELHAQPE